MLDPATTNRSLIWRLLPWLVPLALILIGLVFVTAGLTNSDSKQGPPRDAAPANVAALFTANAPEWARAQVGPTITTEIIDIVMVGATATGASTYSARAVIIRHDAVAQPLAAAGVTVATLAESDTSSVATCVLWDVDVTNQISTPRAAVEIVREVGIHDLGDSTELRDRCRAAIPT